MKDFRTFFNVILMIILQLPLYGLAQLIDLDAGHWIVLETSDESHPSWSSDSRKLLFHSAVNGNTDVFIYDLDADTTFQLTHGLGKAKHPVWHPDNIHIVFDLERQGKFKLCKLDLQSGNITPLFHRDIQGQEACFSASGQQVFFTGYNEVHERWQIYSYDFKYDNLNPLNGPRTYGHTPILSPDGKSLLFEELQPGSNAKMMVETNWYGQVKKRQDASTIEDPSWHPEGLKILYVSYEKDQDGELYSQWIDQTHLTQHTFDPYEISHPMVSPDAQFLALAVKKGKDFDLVIIPLNDF